MSSLRVLHVDDEIDVVKAVRQSLVTMVVDSAATLAAARVCLATVRYDILLVDLNLPDSAGVHTVVALARVGIPIVVLSGLEDSATLAAAAEAGADDYITKSILTPDRLAARLYFAHARARHMARLSKPPKRHMDNERFEALKPFISCGALCH